MDIPPPDEPFGEGQLNFRVGRLEGRVVSLESRMDRHENFMSAEMKDVNIKLDRLIREIASHFGVYRFGAWALVILVMIAGIIASHYWK